MTNKEFAIKVLNHILENTIDISGVAESESGCIEIYHAGSGGDFVDVDIIKDVIKQLETPEDLSLVDLIDELNAKYPRK